MARSQLRHTVKDTAGNVIQNALVRVFEQGTTTPVADLFAGLTGGSAITTLTSNNQGEVVGYLDVARFVDLKVEDNTDAAYYPSTPGDLLSWTAFTETVAVHDIDVVSTDTAQTITGAKTFSGNLISNSLRPTQNEATVFTLFASTGQEALTVPAGYVGQKVVAPSGMIVHPAGSNIGLIVNGNASNAIPLAVIGGVGQTADLQQWYNSAGTVLASVGSDGRISTPYVFSNSSGAPYLAMYGHTIQVETPNPAYTNIVIKGAASQTADLQQWQNSAGTVLGYVNSLGDLVSISGSNFNNVAGLAGGIVFGRQGGQFGVDGQVNGRLGVAALFASDLALSVRAFASQTADLQQWQNSAGTVLAKVSGDGRLGVNADPGAATARVMFTGASSGDGGGVLLVKAGHASDPVLVVASTTGSFMQVRPGGLGLGTTQDAGGISALVAFGITDANLKGVVVRGFASQTADLQQWQDSGGTVLALLAADGTFRGNGQESYIFSTGGVQATFRPNATTQVGLLVKGFASQSADLQQWQNSAGTVLAKVDSTGAATVTGTVVANNTNYPSLTLHAVSRDPVTLFVDGPSNGIFTVAINDGATTRYPFQIAPGGVVGVGYDFPASGGGGKGVLALQNANTVPSTNPTGGGVLYAEAGALKWRGSSGTVTTIAAA